MSVSVHSRLRDRLFAMNEGLVGMSTGYLTELRGVWPALIESAEFVSTDVVELSALSADELPGLAEFLDDRSLNFKHVMVHAPAKDVRGWSDGLVRLLERLPSTVEGFVVHPETLDSPQILRGLGSRVFLENMDSRKSAARTVDELEMYFAELPDARFCFDIAHAQLNDPSLELANSLVGRFSDRLAEVHISSILKSGHHIPLTDRDFQCFEPILQRCVGVPWILEASLY